MQSMGARKLTIRNFNKERQKDYLVYCVLVDKVFSRMPQWTQSSLRLKHVHGKRFFKNIRVELRSWNAYLKL